MVQSKETPWAFEAASETRRRILTLAQRIAPTSCPILITGPTGVGKDVLAEDIHSHSSRSKKRFVPINCAALTPSLFESEAFGHTRGAYTGAVAGKVGLFELADGGTLFLDEIGELPMEAQAKLLRFLANGTFWPLGSTRERTADVRIIAATNRNLPAMLGASFREDLFYRLSAVTLAVPDLERVDVKRIARTTAIDIGGRMGRPLELGDLDVLADLCGRTPWRGGIREMRNAIERYFLLCEPTLSLQENCRLLWQPTRAQSGKESGPFNAGSASAQLTDLVFLAIARDARDVRDLSHRLDCSVQSVYSRLRKLDLKPRDVGHSAVERAIEEARRSVTPLLPWLENVLWG